MYLCMKCNGNGLFHVPCAIMYHQLHVIFALSYNDMRVKMLWHVPTIIRCSDHILKMTPNLQMLGPQENHIAHKKKWKGGDCPPLHLSVCNFSQFHVTSMCHHDSSQLFFGINLTCGNFLI